MIFHLHKTVRTLCFTVMLALAGIAVQCATGWGEPAMDHSGYDKILNRYVDQAGMVAYDQLCRDPGLESYTRYLSETDPDKLNRDEALAYWINAYNAFTLKVICDNYPVESISELHRGGLVWGTIFKSTIWDKKWFQINGKDMSLGHIEHEILRPVFDDPRIHFAIVCAAKSCPPLRNEAYTGQKVNDQLDQQGRRFLAREDLNRFDPGAKTAYLSSIFKWFIKDFGGGKADLLLYLSDFAPTEQIRRSLREETARWDIKWNNYDWSLNRQ